MKKSLAAAGIAALAFTACTSAPKEKELPVLVGHEAQFELNGLNELSGLCLSKDASHLFGEDDEGGVFQINFDGTFSKVWDKVGEMEDLAMDSKTGALYVGLEDPEKFAYKVNLTKSGYDFDNAEELKPSDSVLDLGNDGVEGVTLYKGNLYVGTQTGANLFLYNFADRTMSAPKSLKEVAGCDIKEIAGLDYDEENDWLWVLDSKRFKIYLFKGDASELLAAYEIGETAHDNPEGICVDKKNKCIWIGEDIHDVSLLHKYSFDNL